eukprot:gnl/MRDRNA2_/MRDRNA2_56634_c0_seq1.p1 gnl/MRDRNA2_/MRDRNA2_56634_c0~~gnl/MRDRNA2_/MRDRNA2_56634_c0_seq1.p1  ORF type:complete len:1106 (+),score=142.75 gnl/MRDRNA2_/MRDRNA2_56634_c0_seq1:227-3319(+)
MAFFSHSNNGPDHACPMPPLKSLCFDYKCRDVSPEMSVTKCWEGCGTHWESLRNEEGDANRAMRSKVALAKRRMNEVYFFAPRINHQFEKFRQTSLEIKIQSTTKDGGFNPSQLVPLQLKLPFINNLKAVYHDKVQETVSIITERFFPYAKGKKIVKILKWKEITVCRPKYLSNGDEFDCRGLPKYQRKEVKLEEVDQVTVDGRDLTMFLRCLTPWKPCELAYNRLTLWAPMVAQLVYGIWRLHREGIAYNGVTDRVGWGVGNTDNILIRSLNTEVGFPRIVLANFEDAKYPANGKQYATDWLELAGTITRIAGWYPNREGWNQRRVCRAEETHEEQNRQYCWPVAGKLRNRGWYPLENAKVINFNNFLARLGTTVDSAETPSQHKVLFEFFKTFARYTISDGMYPKDDPDAPTWAYMGNFVRSQHHPISNMAQIRGLDYTDAKMTVNVIEDVQELVAEAQDLFWHMICKTLSNHPEECGNCKVTTCDMTSPYLSSPYLYSKKDGSNWDQQSMRTRSNSGVIKRQLNESGEFWKEHDKVFQKASSEATIKCASAKNEAQCSAVGCCEWTGWFSPTCKQDVNKAESKCHATWPLPHMAWEYGFYDAGKTAQRNPRNHACKGSGVQNMTIDPGSATDTLEKCKVMCEGTSGCRSIDFVTATKRCTLYDRKCTIAGDKMDGPTYYRLRPEFFALKKWKSERLQEAEAPSKWIGMPVSEYLKCVTDINSRKFDYADVRGEHACGKCKSKCSALRLPAQFRQQGDLVHRDLCPVDLRPPCALGYTLSNPKGKLATDRCTPLPCPQNSVHDDVGACTCKAGYKGKIVAAEGGFSGSCEAVECPRNAECPTKFVKDCQVGDGGCMLKEPWLNCEIFPTKSEPYYEKGHCEPNAAAIKRDEEARQAKAVEDANLAWRAAINRIVNSCGPSHADKEEPCNMKKEYTSNSLMVSKLDAIAKRILNFADEQDPQVLDFCKKTFKRQRWRPQSPRVLCCKCVLENVPENVKADKTSLSAMMGDLGKAWEHMVDGLWDSTAGK